MRPRATYRKRSAQKNGGPARVPTYEECLTHILDSTGYSNSIDKPERVPATDKRKFRQIERHPERLRLQAYQRIIGKLRDQHSLDLQILGKPQAEVLEVELREFLKRYEHLLPQLTIGRAEARQVRWTLSARFFVPWLALRIAFHLRQRQHSEAKEDEHWFLPPASRGKVGSCFMLVVDRNIRKSGESREAMTKRLCDGQKVGDHLDAAKSLGRDFRHYRKGDCTPLDARLDLIHNGSPQTPELLAMMVLARAIDRNVQDAIKTFGSERAFDLVKYFRLSYDHFRRLLDRLGAELPKDNEQAWLFLQSQTFTGNTPFEADRYYPLTEPYLNGLAKKISVELQNSDKNGRLAYVPTAPSDLGKGEFDQIASPLPKDIHEAVRKGDFSTVVTASESTFPSKSRDAKEAVRIAKFFSCLALSAYDAVNAHGPLTPSQSDAPKVLKEAARLFRLAYDQTKGVQKARYAIEYLRFLLTLHRPKAKTELPLARKLCLVAANFYRKSGGEGSSMFLRGCLFWLEGNEKRAMRVFLDAAKCGRASFHEYDWIRLLEYAPELADRTSNRRGLKRFLKLAELEGVLYREPAPRTNLIEKELRQHANARNFQNNFKPFPA